MKMSRLIIKVVHQLYNIGFNMALPGVLMRLLVRSRRECGYRKNMAERLGCYRRPARPAALWFHAVSMGEVMALKTLIDQQSQHHSVVLTTMTPSGWSTAKSLFGDAIQSVYVPYDIPWILRRFLRAFKPQALIIMETEIWPNMLHAAQRAKLPVALINARISDRSYPSYARYRTLMADLLQSIQVIMAQSQKDADRFRHMGADPAKIQVVPNIKFSNVIESDEVVTDIGDRRLLWVAGSTHEGEEARLIHVHQCVQKKHPQARWILVPRHISRVPTLEKLLVEKGLSYQTCTSVGEMDAALSNHSVCLLAATGLLNECYAMARLAFVGGSWVPVGGHNLIEPAAWGTITTSGPELANCLAVRDTLLGGQALYVVEEAQGLVELIDRAFSDTGWLKQASCASKKAVLAAKACSLSSVEAWINHLFFIQ